MHAHIAAILVGVATGLAIFCSVGLAIMQKALERLHFSAAVTSLGSGLMVLAVWIVDPNWQSRIKVSLVAIVLFLMNSVLSHSTARAIRIHDKGQFEPRPSEHLAQMTEENPTGAKP